MANLFRLAVGQQATAALWQKCELRIFAGQTYERFPNTGGKKREKLMQASEFFCHAVGQQANAALWQKCELRIFAERTYERFSNTGGKKTGVPKYSKMGEADAGIRIFARAL